MNETSIAEQTAAQAGDFMASTGVFSLTNLFLSVCIIIIASVFIGTVHKIFRLATSRCLSKDDSRSSQRQRVLNFIFNLLRIAVIAVAALAILQIYGVNVSGLIAGLGIVGIIVGFALQDALKDIVMSFHVLSDDFFNVGDVVRYKDIEGEVISMTLQTTKVRDIATEDIIAISNRNLEEITKVSDCVDIDMGLSYDDDPARVQEVLEQACARIEQIEGVTSAEFRGTQSFEDSYILYRVRFCCPPAKKPPLRRAANRVLQDTIAEAGLTIPFEQVDVHMRP